MKQVRNCSLLFNQGLTCNQNITGCNFDAGVQYLNISSSNTSQTISHTNFHNIAGTDLNNLKTLVIPEDYTTEHTVEIYGDAGPTVHTNM